MLYVLALLCRLELTNIQLADHASRGYVGDIAATNQTFSEGWIKTGDILKMDENENFWVTDRLKEVCLDSLIAYVLHGIELTAGI